MFELSDFASSSSAPAHLRLLNQLLQSSGKLFSLNSQNSSTTGLDSLAHVRCFESAIDDLSKLELDVRSQLSLAQQTCHQLEQDRYRLSVFPVLLEKLQSLEQLYASVESGIVDVSSGALLVAEQLESLDKQKQRALESRDLISFFFDFYSSTGEGGAESSRLLAIKNGHDGKSRAASILRKLLIMSKEMDDLPQISNARQAIQKYYDQLENELLQDFDQSYKDGCVEDMKRYARILFDFNGGMSCVQMFVNQHEFFTRQLLSRLDGAGGSGGSNHDLSTADKPLPQFLDDYKVDVSLDSNVVNLLQDVLQTVSTEWPVIQEIFPQSITVLQSFVQRLYLQMIQPAIEHALQEAAKLSSIHYSEMLFKCHEATMKLTADLLTLLGNHIQDQSQIHILSGSFKRFQQDLFTLFLDGEKYMDMETRNLARANELALKDFVEFIEMRKVSARNRSMFSKISASTGPQLQLPTTTQDLTMGFHSAMAPAIDRIDVIMTVYQHALQRCRKLSAHGDVSRNNSQIFLQLLDFVCRKYLEPCLDVTLENMLAESGTRNEPDLRYLESVSKCNIAIHALQKLFKSEMMSSITLQPSFYRDLISKKNELVVVLENKINAIINKLISSVIEWISGSILGKQKKFDYRPRDTEVVTMATLTSSPCAKCCEYLKKVDGQAKMYLDGKNFGVVMTEIAMQFHRFLLEHLKKFVINTNGGLLLAKDLVKYQETVVNQLRIDGVTDRYEALRQLGTLYIVKPEYLKTLLDEEELISRMDTAVLHEYVSKREDYKQARLDLLFDHSSNAFVTSPTADTSAATTRWGDAVDALGGTMEEVGESLKKMINL